MNIFGRLYRLGGDKCSIVSAAVGQLCIDNGCGRQCSFAAPHNRLCGAVVEFV